MGFCSDESGVGAEWGAPILCRLFLLCCWQQIVGILGVRLEVGGFREFVALKSQFQSFVFGVSQRQHAVFLEWYLRNRALLWRAQWCDSVTTDRAGGSCAAWS